MIEIRFVCNQEKLTPAEKPVIASGDVNSVQLRVEFCQKWDKYAKAAVFFTEKDPTPIEVPMTNSACTVPPEVLAESGTFYFGVRGVNTDDTEAEVLTSDVVGYRVVNGAPSGVEAGPTPDVYQQILTNYGKMDANKQNKLAWVTDADLEAMFVGTYKGEEDEDPEGNGYASLPIVPGEGVDSLVRAMSAPGGTGEDPAPKATGDFAIALGRYSTAPGKNSVSLGYDTDATGEMSFVANGANAANGPYSAAFGGSNTANGNKSFTVGHANIADAENAFVCGYSNKITEGAKNGFVANTGNEVSAPNAAAFGTENKAAGDSSLAVGGNNEATGVRAFATGTRTKASGAFAFTGGTSTEANGNASFAIGARTKAKQNFSFAGGNDTETNGMAGFAHGSGLKITKDAQAALGKYNAPAADLLFMVGNGTADTDRKNAFAVKENSIVIGNTEITEAQLQKLLALLD